MTKGKVIPIDAEARERARAEEAFKRGDHVEVAERLIAQLARASGHVIACGRAVYHYESARGIWIDLRQSILRGMAQGYAGHPIKVGRGKKRPLHVSYLTADGIARCVAEHLSILDDSFFDEAIPGLAFKDHFVTFEKGEAVAEKHSPDHRARFGVPYEWKPKHPANHWRVFLRSIWEGADDQEDRRSFLQEFLGACLTGTAAKLHKCLVLIGAGSNGKGVLQELLLYLFPADLLSAVAPNRWKKGEYLATLHRSLINVVGELPSTSLADSEIFKAVVAGDSVTAKRLYENPITFAPRCGHLFSVNDNQLPETTDYGEGLWRRFVCLSFDRQFVEGDRKSGWRPRDQLMADLIGDVPGILAWGIRGAARLHQVGRYTIPQSSDAAKRAWRSESDSIGQWLQERTISVTEAVSGPKEVRKKYTLGSKLAENYRKFCANCGHKAVPPSGFGSALKTRGVLRRHLDDGNYWALRIKGPARVLKG